MRPIFFSILLLLTASAGAVAQDAAAQETGAEASEPEAAGEGSASGRPPAAHLPLAAVELVLLDTADQRAVLRVGDGPLQIVGPGDEIAGTLATARSVAAGKLVVEVSLPQEQPPIRLTAWIFLERPDQGGSRVQYLDPRLPIEMPDSMPVVIEQVPEGSPEPTGPVPPVIEQVP